MRSISDVCVFLFVRVVGGGEFVLVRLCLRLSGMYVRIYTALCMHGIYDTH